MRKATFGIAPRLALLIAIAVFFFPDTGMASVPTYGGINCDNRAAGVGSTTHFCSITASPNSLILVGWTNQTSNGHGADLPATLTDTCGLTYTLAISNYVSGTDETAALYWAETGACSGSDTVTETSTNSLNFSGIAVAQISGAALSSPIEVTAVGSGSPTTGIVSTGNLVTTQNDELIFTEIADGNTTNVTAPGSFTIISGSGTQATLYGPAATVGTYTGQASITSSSRWNMVAMTIKSANPTVFGTRHKSGVF